MPVDDGWHQDLADRNWIFLVPDSMIARLSRSHLQVNISGNSCARHIPYVRLTPEAIANRLLPQFKEDAHPLYA
jgi:hypothetical protein